MDNLWSYHTHPDRFLVIWEYNFVRLLVGCATHLFKILHEITKKFKIKITEKIWGWVKMNRT